MNWMKRHFRSIVVGVITLVVAVTALFLISGSQQKNGSAKAGTEHVVTHDYPEKVIKPTLFYDKKNCAIDGSFDYGSGCKKLISSSRFGDCIAAERFDPIGEFYNQLGDGRNGKCLMMINLDYDKVSKQELLTAVNFNFELSFLYTVSGVSTATPLACDFTISNLMDSIVVIRGANYLKTICNYSAPGADIGLYRNSIQVSYPNVGTEKVASDVYIGSCDGLGGIFPKCSCPNTGWFNSGTDEYYSQSLKKCLPTNHIALCNNLAMQSMYELFQNNITSKYYMVGGEVESGVSVPINLCYSKTVQRQIYNMLEEWDTNYGRALLSRINDHSQLNKVGKNIFGAWNQAIYPKGFTWKFMYQYEGFIFGIGAGCRGRVPVFYGKDDVVNWPTCETELSNGFGGYDFLNYSKMDDRVLSGGNTSSVFWHELMHVIDGNSATYNDKDWIDYINRANTWRGLNEASRDEFYYPSTIYNLTTTASTGNKWDGCGYDETIREPFGRWWLQTLNMNGFIGCYGRTNHLEDRAQYLELLMSPRVRNEGFIRSNSIGGTDCCKAKEFISLENFMENDSTGNTKIKGLIKYLGDELSVNTTPLLTYSSDYRPKTGDDTITFLPGVQEKTESLLMNDYVNYNSAAAQQNQIALGYTLQIKGNLNNNYYSTLADKDKIFAYREGTSSYIELTTEADPNDPLKIKFSRPNFSPETDITYKFTYRILNPDNYIHSADTTVSVVIKGEPSDQPKSISINNLTQAQLEGCLRVDGELPQQCLFTLPQTPAGYKTDQEILVKLAANNLSYDLSSKAVTFPDAPREGEPGYIPPRLLIKPTFIKANTAKDFKDFARVEQVETVPFQTKYSRCKVVDKIKLLCSNFAFADVLGEWDSNVPCKQIAVKKAQCIVDQINEQRATSLQPFGMPSANYTFIFNRTDSLEVLPSNKATLKYSNTTLNPNNFNQQSLSRFYDYSNHTAKTYCNDENGVIVAGPGQGNVVINSKSLSSCTFESDNILQSDEIDKLVSITLNSIFEDKQGVVSVLNYIQSKPERCVKEIISNSSKAKLVCYSYALEKNTSYQMVLNNLSITDGVKEMPVISAEYYGMAANSPGYELKKVITNVAMLPKEAALLNYRMQCNTWGESSKSYVKDLSIHNMNVESIITLSPGDTYNCLYTSDAYKSRDQAEIVEKLPNTAMIAIQFSDSDPATKDYYTYRAGNDIYTTNEFVIENEQYIPIFERGINSYLGFYQLNATISENSYSSYTGKLIVDLDGLTSTTADRYDFSPTNVSPKGPIFKLNNDPNFIKPIVVFREEIIPYITSEENVNYQGFYKPDTTFEIKENKQGCAVYIDDAGNTINNCEFTICSATTNLAGYFSCLGKPRPLVLIPGQGDNLIRPQSITVAALSVSERAKVVKEISVSDGSKGIEAELTLSLLNKPETIVDCTVDSIVHTITGGGTGSNYGIGLLDEIEKDQKLTCDFLATGSKVSGKEGGYYSQFSYPKAIRVGFAPEGDQSPNYTSNCTQDLVLSKEPGLEDQAIPRLSCNNISLKFITGKQYLVVDLNGEAEDTSSSIFAVNNENLDTYLVKNGINSTPAFSMAMDVVEPKVIQPTISLTPTSPIDGGETASSAKSVKKTTSNPFAREQSVYEAKYAAVPNTLVATGNQTPTNTSINNPSSAQSSVKKSISATPTAQAGEVTSATNFSSQTKNESSNFSILTTATTVASEETAKNVQTTTKPVTNSTLIVASSVVGGIIVIAGLGFGVYHWISVRKRAKLILDSSLNQLPEVVVKPTELHMNSLLDHLNRLKK